MFENRYLSRWQEAGLLDPATVDRIRAYEATQHRPLWLWAVTGLGCLAICIGVISIVAANWHEISDSIKLGIDFALLILLAAGTFVAELRGWPRIRDFLALLLFGLVLASIALISQIYQLDGETWQAVATWLLICTPFLILGTQTRLLAAAWALAALWLTLSGWTSLLAPLHDLVGKHAQILPAWLLSMSFVLAGWLLAFWPQRKMQAALLWQIALASLLVTGSLPQMLYVWNRDITLFWAEPLIGLVLTATILAVIFLRRPQNDLRPFIILLIAAMLCWLTSFALHRAVAETSMVAKSQRELLSILLAAPFILLWAIAGWLALGGGRRLLFIVCFAVIAIRILIFYWEAFGGLLQTGLGLIAGGILCLALAALGRWLLLRTTRPQSVRAG